MNDSGRQRGSIILYAMLTMTMMLAMGLTLSSLFIGKLKGAAAARDSTTAIYIADSAVEKCLYEARQQVDETPLVRPDAFPSGGTYKVASPSAGNPSGVDVTDKCKSLGAASFTFRASGTFRGVTRTLEITQ